MKDFMTPAYFCQTIEEIGRFHYNGTPPHQIMFDEFNRITYMYVFRFLGEPKTRKIIFSILLAASNERNLFSFYYILFLCDVFFSKCKIKRHLRSLTSEFRNKCA